MSDQPTELAPESVEPMVLPTPEVSPPSEPTPSAALDVGQLVSQLKESILPELKQYVDRSTQSVKDRRIAGLEQRVSDLTSAKAALEAHGGDINKAARELAIDELLGRGDSPANLGKVGEDWGAGVQKILSEAASAGIKISADDPELQAVSKGSYASWADAYAAVNRVVLRRAKGVSTANVPAEVSGLPITSKSVDELTSQLTNLIASGAPTEAILNTKRQLLEATQR